jgi:hypothetical protein
MKTFPNYEVLRAIWDRASEQTKRKWFLTAGQWFERMEEGHLDAALETITKLNERAALKEKLRTGKIIKSEDTE